MKTLHNNIIALICIAIALNLALITKATPYTMPGADCVPADSDSCAYASYETPCVELCSFILNPPTNLCAPCGGSLVMDECTGIATSFECYEGICSSGDAIHCDCAYDDQNIVDLIVVVCET